MSSLSDISPPENSSIRESLNPITQLPNYPIDLWLHHDAAADHDRLSREERRGRRRQEHGRAGHVLGCAPAFKRRRLHDRAAPPLTRAGAKGGLDETWRNDVHADARRDRARERLAEGEHTTLHCRVELRICSSHAGE